jgi:hypothetical protein
MWLLIVASVIILVVASSINRNSLYENFSNFDYPFKHPSKDWTCVCPKGTGGGIDLQNKLCLYCKDKTKTIASLGKNNTRKCYSEEIIPAINIREQIKDCPNGNIPIEIKNDRKLANGLYCYECPDKHSGEKNWKATWTGDAVSCTRDKQTLPATDIKYMAKCPNQIEAGKYCVDPCPKGYKLTVIDEVPKCTRLVNPTDPLTINMTCFPNEQKD